MINENTSIREVVTALPEATRILDRVGIEYGCDANESLEEACRGVGRNPGDILAEIQALHADLQKPANTRDWRHQSVRELIAHILDTHHRYLREELPRLEKLMRKVYENHGMDYPAVLKIHEIFFGLKAELDLHLQKEEIMLFPYISSLESAAESGVRPACPFGTVQNPIRMMLLEHENAQEAVSRIRTDTADYAVPENACLGFRLLLHGLEQLEGDLQRHIRLEDETLFSRAVELERQTA